MNKPNQNTRVLRAAILLSLIFGVIFLTTIQTEARSDNGNSNGNSIVTDAPAADLFSHDGQAATPTDKPSEEVFKNIQVFKGMPSSQMYQVMFYMRGALGISCNHCHVNFTDFEKDDNPNKQIARKMIQMVRELNQNKFGGEMAVTCNTCHRGHTKPVAPLSFAPITKSVEKPAASSSATPAAITTDQIFERFLSATGGATAQGKLTNSELIGSMMSSEGWTAPLKVLLKSPEKLLMTFDISWTSYQAFNGTSGWSQDNHGLHDVTGRSLALLKRQAALFQPARLKEQYSSLKYIGKETIGDHEAYVIEGVIAEAGPERLYFDTVTGLLVRITSSTETVLGILTREIDIEDYHEVGGVKIPFMVSQMAPDFSSAQKIESVKHNVVVDDAKFDKPTAPLKSSIKQ